MKAVERYMLGDLAVSEVEEFERHFFDCPQCSEELRALTIFQENARAVFAEQDLVRVPASVPAPESAARWWSGLSPLLGRSWAPALATLLIGIFSGYLLFTPRQTAQAISAYPLYAQARGEETNVSPAETSKFYTLYFDKTWDADYPSYRTVFLDASGAVKFTTPVNAGAPGETFHMLVPSHQLAAAKYVLVMQGVDGAGKGTELARFPFTLRFK